MGFLVKDLVVRVLVWIIPTPHKKMHNYIASSRMWHASKHILSKYLCWGVVGEGVTYFGKCVRNSRSEI